jgi:hypothetical protein
LLLLLLHFILHFFIASCLSRLLFLQHEGDIMASASPFTRVTRFVPSSRKIVQFSEGQIERQQTDKVM